jgi:hypothetical protein
MICSTLIRNKDIGRKQPKVRIDKANPYPLESLREIRSVAVLRKPCSSSNSVKVARSTTNFAMPPKLSNNVDRMRTPSVDTLPMVGFIAKRAALAAGWGREPFVSVPRLRGLNPAETPMTDQVHEPTWLYIH